MPGTTRISDVVKTQGADRITAFNRAVVQDPHVYYLPRDRGAFRYLDRCDYGQVGRIGRLTYTGSLDRWEFAIYRYIATAMSATPRTSGFSRERRR